MIRPSEFFKILLENNIDYFSGVPDSLLKDFGAYVMDNSDNHVIAANEGAAIARAAGYHLATGKIGLVYMQNSGQGNAINPLLSLADRDVYSIPMLLLIGWRGEPGKKDEPQHIKQGKVTTDLLDACGIEHLVLSDDPSETRENIQTAVRHILNHREPYAIVVKKDTFENYSLKGVKKTDYEHNRESAIKLVADNLDNKVLIVSTTGKTSRELFEYRGEKKQGHGSDFLCVGNMGHASSIAGEIARSRPDREVYCFDGDGAFIMHMGALTDIGKTGPKNLKHIVFNNGAHDSVGGQPTAGFNLDMPGIAISSGYKWASKAQTTEEILSKMSELKSVEGPALLEIRVNKGSRKDLGRPTTTPLENKKEFMKNISEN